MIVDEFITGFGRCGDWFGADTEEADAPLYGLSGSLAEDDEVTDALLDVLNEVFV